VTELAKSAFSYAWSMSLFGIQQFVNLLNPSDMDKSASPGLGPFDPKTWMNMGTVMLRQMAGTDSAQPQPLEQAPFLTSVLDRDVVPPLDDLDSPHLSAPPAETSYTGWGPMP